MLWRPQPNYATHFVRPCGGRGRRCLRRPPDRSSRIASDDDATRTTAISSTYGATFFSVPGDSARDARASAAPLSLTPSRVVIKPS